MVAQRRLCGAFRVQVIKLSAGRAGTSVQPPLQRLAKTSVHPAAHRRRPLKQIVPRPLKET
jgi:hypothetical protein